MFSRRSTLLNYQIIAPQFLNASRKASLEIQVSAGLQDVCVESIQFLLPLEINAVSAAQTDQNDAVISSSGQVDDLKIVTNDSNPVVLSVNNNNTPGTIVLSSIDKSNILIKKNTSFVVHIQISCISAMIGACKIAVQEKTGLSKETIQVRQSSLTMNKFPETFQLTDFKVDKEQIHSGELAVFSWQAILHHDFPMRLYLAASNNNAITTEVTEFGDALGKYAYSVPIETQTGEMSFELRATVLDKRMRPLLTQNFSQSSLTVTVLPPAIKHFVAYSNSLLANDKIKMGSQIVLNWQTSGKVERYLLEIDGATKKELPGDATSYTDVPAYSTFYRLSAYSKQSPSVVVDSKVTQALLYRPQYQPESIFKADALIMAQISTDGSKLYIASDVSIHIMTMQTGQITETLKIANGINNILLSPDDSMLYITNSHTATVTVMATANNTLIQPAMAFPRSPDILRLNHDGSVLYTAVGNILSATNTVTRHSIFSIETSAKLITAFELMPDGDKLCIISSDTDAIEIRDATTGKEFGDPLEIQLKSTNSTNKSFSISNTNSAQLKPCGLALSADGQQALVGLSEVGQVVLVKLTSSPTESAIVLDDIQNPESLVLLKDSSQNDNDVLYAIAESSHAVIAHDLVTNHSLEISVGTNPRQMIATRDGLRVFVVCANSLWSFWTQMLPVSRPVVLLTTPSTKAEGKFENRRTVLSNNTQLALPKKDATAQAIQQLNEAFVTENRERAKVLENGEFGFFFPNLRKKDYKEKSAESLARFGVFFPAASTVIKSTQTLSKEQESDKILAKTEDTIKSVPSAADVATALANKAVSSPAVLKDQLSKGWFASSQSVLEKQDSQQFSLTLHQGYRESVAQYEQRVSKIIATFKQAPILGGIDEPSIIKTNKTRTAMIMVTPNRTDQVGVLQAHLEKITGLTCQATTVPQVPIFRI